MDVLSQDLRVALRRIQRAPALATAIVLTIGLGLGAAGAIFTASDAALVEPLPYARPERLVHVWELRSGTDERGPTSYPTLLDWRARAQSFSALEAYDPSNLTAGVGDEARMLRGAQVTAGFFRLLGVRISAGRDFLQSEDATTGAGVAIVSDRFARSVAGGIALDQTVVINGTPTPAAAFIKYARLLNFQPKEGFLANYPMGDPLWIALIGANGEGNRVSSYADLTAKLHPDFAFPRSDNVGISSLKHITTITKALYAILAILGATALLHRLLVTTRQNRRLMATLRSLGLTPAQVRRAHMAHGAVVSTVAVAVAIPLGIVVATVTWRHLAEYLGAVAHPATSALITITIAVATALVGVVIGECVAWREQRSWFGSEFYFSGPPVLARKAQAYVAEWVIGG